MSRLFLFILVCFTSISAYTQKKAIKTELPVRVINIDYSTEKGPLNTMFNECGFRYIRFHGLLTDDMGIYKEDKNGNPEYNYMYVDALFDYLLGIGIKPFVELGFMPISS